MAWDDYFPDYKVPKEIRKLVDVGMIVDSTLPQDASPNFDAVLRNGEILTIWVEHPKPHRRFGQSKRYGLRIAEPLVASRPVLETNSLERLLDTWKEIMKMSGGPRMGMVGGWRIPMYQYMEY